jgi:antitoxin component HigA of HigAB toxin-antitoxin module
MGVLAEYRKLLLEYTPQPIYSDRAYRRALNQLERLMKPRPNRASSMLIEMLSVLVQDYESRHHRDL